MQKSWAIRRWPSSATASGAALSRQELLPAKLLARLEAQPLLRKALGDSQKCSQTKHILHGFPFQHTLGLRAGWKSSRFESGIWEFRISEHEEAAEAEIFDRLFWNKGRDGCCQRNVQVWQPSSAFQWILGLKAKQSRELAFCKDVAGKGYRSQCWPQQCTQWRRS